MYINILKICNLNLNITRIGLVLGMQSCAN